VSGPRQCPDGKGEISPVSVKRKLRDLVLEKEGFRPNQYDNFPGYMKGLLPLLAAQAGGGMHL
jgi:hypothetical protein